MKPIKMPKKAAEETTTMIIRDVPKDVHRSFKARCATVGTSIRARIIELMQTDIQAKTKHPYSAEVNLKKQLIEHHKFLSQQVDKKK